MPLEPREVLDVLTQSSSRLFRETNRRLQKYQKNYAMYAKKFQEMNKHLQHCNHTLLGLETQVLALDAEVTKMVATASSPMMIESMETRLQQLRHACVKILGDKQVYQEKADGICVFMQQLQMKSCECIALFQSDYDAMETQKNVVVTIEPLQKSSSKDVQVLLVESDVLLRDTERLGRRHQKIQHKTKDLVEAVTDLMAIGPEQETTQNISELEQRMNQQEQNMSEIMKQKSKAQSELVLLQQQYQQCISAMNTMCQETSPELQQQCSLQFKMCRAIQENIQSKISEIA